MSLPKVTRTPQKSNSYALRSNTANRTQSEMVSEEINQQQNQILDVVSNSDQTPNQIANASIVQVTGIPLDQNLIEPQDEGSFPVFQSENSSQASAQLNVEIAPSSTLGNLSITDLENLITSITRSVISNARPNSESQTQRDTIRLPSHLQPDFDKIPDIIKCLREFSGNPADFNAWKNSVDRILELYRPLMGSAKYIAILSAIRNKITGDADAVLDSYDTRLEWEDIRRCLTLHYADRRNLNTLESELVSLTQGGKTCEDFHQKLHSHLSLIINKVSRSETSQEAKSALIDFYKQKALDTFIKGLKGDLPRLISLREPSDLSQALNLVIKVENQTGKTHHAHVNSDKHNGQEHIQKYRPDNYYNQQRVEAFPQSRHQANTSRNTNFNNRSSSWRNSNRQHNTFHRNNGNRPNSSSNNERNRPHIQQNFHVDSLQDRHNYSQTSSDHSIQRPPIRDQDHENSQSDMHGFSDIHFLE